MIGCSHAHRSVQSVFGNFWISGWMLPARSASGAVTGLFRALATGVNIHFNLCGMCALGLREYLRPAILLDPMYLDAKRQLTEEAWT